MKRSKILIRSLLVVYFCLYFSLIIGQSAESNLVINASHSIGEWERGTVTQREVVSTDKPNLKSEIEIYVAHKGKYQLIAYVHHNWRKSCPCIYVEAVDYREKLYRGYHKIENIWYLGPKSKGRWFLVSLSDNPYWELPKGILKIRFWAEGNGSSWGNLSVPMEDKVSIGQFFLIPVTHSDSGTFLPNVLNIESGTGNWQICGYDREYATNFIKTKEKNSLLNVKSDIPVSGNYLGWLSVLSRSDGKLEIGIKNRSREDNTIVQLRADNKWNLIRTGPVRLDKGPCSIYFKNLGQNEVMIDFFSLIPED